MSYILDALRKAERERHLGQPPNLTAPPLAAEPGRRRLGPWLGVGLGLGLGLNAALLAFFLTRPQPAAPPGIAASPTPVATAPTAAPEPSSPPEPRSLPPAGETTGRQKPPMTTREPAQPVALAQPAVVATTAKPTAPAPATPRKESVDKPVLSEPLRPAVPRASRERREEPSRPPLTPGSVTLAPAPEPAPLLETLSAGARRGIPALNLDIHIHSADPAKRFVVINGRRYREGDRLGEGPVLETVTRDGAILRQGGQRFRLSVRR